MFRKKKKSPLLEDVLRAAYIELGRSARSNDMGQICRTVSKWDALFQELVAPVLNSKIK